MGKKRSRQQSSNGVATGDSSESDGPQNVDKQTSNSPQCPHASKSINQNMVKKNINLEDIANNNFCSICTKQGKSIKGEEIYVCLQCGTKSCSLQHSKEHYDLPRSDPHALFFNLSNKTVWCHGCGAELAVSSIAKLSACVKNVENMYEKHLKGPITKNNLRIEPISEENNTDKFLQAVPIFPPKTKTQNVGVKGLENLGNTCFFNSVLQCLARTPNLIETLREMEVNKEVSIEISDGRILSGQLEKQNNLCHELAETLSEIQGPGRSFSPRKLLALLRKKVHQFIGNDQQDAHELLRHLLDSVRCSDLKRYRKIILNELNLNGIDSETVDSDKQKELKKLDREVTEKVMLVPDQVFRGFLVSRLVCQECKHSSECVESFLDLSLPVSSEKPHPPSHRRNKNCINDSFSPPPFAYNEEKGGNQMSKHKLKKERKLERKKNRGRHQNVNFRKNDAGQGEGVPSISEKGESDAEGDDGDVDSEESDKKTETGGPRGNILCAGISSSHSRLELSASSNSPSSSQRTPYIPLSMIDGTFGPNLIPLMDDGVPDISKLDINDSSEPQLQTFVRDSETIAREEPSWLSEIHDFSGLLENGNSLLSSDPTSPPNSKNSKNENDSGEGKNEKSEKDEEISSDDKTIVGDNLVDNKDESLKSWLNNQQESIYDENFQAFGPEPAPNNHESENLIIEPEKNGGILCNSDDEAMVGSLFEECNSVPETSGECSVQACLAQFTSIELMTGSNKVCCEQCTLRANKGKKDGKNVYTMSTKQLLISEVPPVLILHIKRFQVQMSSFKKLNKHVAFPLELDISPFCTADIVKKSPNRLKYSLYGIVEHSGNFSGGHYVAYVKVENSWFCISDSYVSETTEDRVLKVQAYLLFYKSTSS